MENKTEQNCLISVIVPVYNILDCLERCVNSICGQTWKNLEILLVDDGSTDGTGKLCDLLAEKDDRIRVFHKPNGGSSSARNLGISMAKGKWIGFVDSDDWLDTDALKKVLARLTTLVARGTAPDMMICNYVYEHVEDNTTLTVRYTNVFPQNRLFNWTPSSSTQAMVTVRVSCSSS